MADTAARSAAARRETGDVYEFGGLRFEISFRGRGPTLRVLADVDGGWTEMLRFDDFADDPHFHAPPAVQTKFDRALGEPLAWFIEQLRDHLAAWVERAGFASVLERVDVAEVARNVATLEHAMERCVPDGFTRVPGFGLQKR